MTAKIVSNHPDKPPKTFFSFSHEIKVLLQFTPSHPQEYATVLSAFISSLPSPPPRRLNSLPGNCGLNHKVTLLSAHLHSPLTAKKKPQSRGAWFLIFRNSKAVTSFLLLGERRYNLQRNYQLEKGSYRGRN